MPGEERRQRRDNVGDEVVVDKREPVGYRHSPELPWDSLAEAYAEGWLGLHIHFRTGTVEGGIAGDWCAAFNKAEHQFDVVDCQVVGNEKGRAHLREKTDVRQPVLVFDIKPVELPETVFLDSVLSMVRLQPLDDCLRGWRGTPNHVLAFARDLASILENGKLQPPLEVGRDSSAVMGESQFVDEVVEGGSEVVNTVPDDGAEFDRRRFEHFEPRELVEVINIEIRPNSVRAFIGPNSNFGFKALQVVQRPIEPSFMVEGHSKRQYAKRCRVAA